MIGKNTEEQDIFTVIFTNDSDVCDVRAMKLIADYADETRQIKPLFPEDKRDAYKCFAAFFEPPRENIIGALKDIGYDADSIEFEMFRVNPTELLAGIRKFIRIKDDSGAASEKESLMVKHAQDVCERLKNPGYFDTAEDVAAFLEKEYLPGFCSITAPVKQLLLEFNE